MPGADTVNALCGNALLRELIEGNPGYQRNLRFTLLRTLPKVLTNREVIQYERLYKDMSDCTRTSSLHARTA